MVTKWWSLMANVSEFPSSSRSIAQVLVDLRLSYAVVATGLILLGFFWNKLDGFSLRYVALIVSVFLANVFIFVVNDFYDAADDAKDPVKRARNLFCSADMQSLGKLILYASLGFSLLLGGVVSIPVFVIVVLLNFLGFSYSAPPIKLRDRLYWDWIFVFLWKGLVIAAGYVYFFGIGLVSEDNFIYGSLLLVLLYSLISQMDNQIRDFVVDKNNLTNHSVQRLGYKTASRIKRFFLTLFFGFSLVFSYVLGLYITMVLIVINISLYYFVSPSKHSYVLDFANQWVVVLFLEHFMGYYSFRQQLLFVTWIVVMIGLAVFHVKRTNLFRDETQLDAPTSQQ